MRYGQYGDIFISRGQDWEIMPRSVTFDKMQDVSPSVLLGTELNSKITEIPYTQTGLSLLQSKTPVEVKQQLNLLPNKDILSYDEFLNSIAALGTAQDKIVYICGVDQAKETDCTSFGRHLIGLTEVKQLNETIGLKSLAFQEKIDLSHQCVGKIPLENLPEEILALLK